ncbi:restriction endonuclease S subunit [Sulfuricella denitrificans skB26]|uniref:Restriction endonuclease S subunit n=1 Tax=Sulfuricella denitrificans (strain DSM 22764 / NBRC 105220 / skB26) TaxID=1163617 RepID=S6B2B3_SULDS|nr:restriction endonuclease subunit S [Sulfuricella denitrificans]BAN34797.1 restriction endonuclease S subunit [Sulfuricella denitrificans skB26]
MTMMALGQTARFINGAAFKPTDWGNEGLPIIRIQNLTGTGEKFNFTTRQVKAELIVEPGDLLVSWSATLDVYRWAGPRGLLNQHIFKVLPKSEIDPDYLFFALKSALAELSSKTHGSTMKHVVRGDFESTQIRVPPLEEQRRIVDILSRAEGIVRLRCEAQKKTTELIPGIFLDMFGDPATNPKGWPRALLGKLLNSIDSGQSPKCHSRQKLSNEWGVLRLSAISPCDYDEAKHKALPTEISPDLSVEVQAGEVLLSRKNTYELVGASAYVWKTEGKILLPDLIFRLSIGDHERLHPIYLWKLLTIPSKRELLRTLASGSAGSMPNISKQRLRTLEIEVPPLGLQARFAESVEQIRSIQSQQSAATEKAEATFDALMTQVFS